MIKEKIRNGLGPRPWLLGWRGSGVGVEARVGVPDVWMYMYAGGGYLHEIFDIVKGATKML